MLTEFNFHLTQVSYVRAAMNVVATYKPDDYSVAMVDSLLGAAKTVRLEYLAKFHALAVARGATNSARQSLHDACVSVYLGLRSSYRKHAGAMASIANLPVQDESLDATFRRGQAISKAWAGLPNPPNWTSPFKLGTLDRTAFDGLLAALDMAVNAETDADQSFQLREGMLHDQQAVLADFATAALMQGRAQFTEGAAERQLIERIPTAPATQEPGQAVMALAQSPSAGAVRLEFSAPHATSYQVWQQAPGAAEFTLVTDEVLNPGVYAAGSLAAGTHRFRVVGVNSRGEGPASVVAEIAVAAEAAA